MLSVNGVSTVSDMKFLEIKEYSESYRISEHNTGNHEWIPSRQTYKNNILSSISTICVQITVPQIFIGYVNGFIGNNVQAWTLT